ncbi:MAG: hypothetical protein R3Y24_05270 [Eubacteriales bacterium]
MIIEKASVEDAILQGKKLPFMFCRNLSAMYLGKTVENIDLSEVLEIRFFGKHKEVRVVNHDKELNAVVIEGEDKDEVVIKAYRIQNKQYGSQIEVACHLGFDEDGQVFVETRRLINWR